MKTPTPQEQAEMLIEKHSLLICGVKKPFSLLGKKLATKSAIVTVETVIKALNEDIPWFELNGNYLKTRFLQKSGDVIKDWQEVLTILKGKL